MKRPDGGRKRSGCGLIARKCWTSITKRTAMAFVNAPCDKKISSLSLSTPNAVIFKKSLRIAYCLASNILPSCSVAVSLQ